MKLLVQGDDYGFTKGVTFGILDAADNGILTCTGLFANAPYAEFAVKEMAKRPHVCLGIDFNIVSGTPISEPQEIPHLVDGNGDFTRSGVYVKNPLYQSEEGRRTLFPYDEVYRELRAQYDKFVELAKKKPGYLHGHSIMPEPYNEAMQQIAEEEGIGIGMDMQAKWGFVNKMKLENKELSFMKKEFNPLAQLEKDPEKDFFALADRFLEYEYVSIGGHPGFVDNELMGLTTLSLERMKDHAFYTSKAMKQWIKDHHVELISYYDLKS